MKQKLRFLGFSKAKASECMAVDEAIMLAREADEVPDTLRFYVFEPPAVTIGYFQSKQQEVDIKKAGSLDVDIVRRLTGGGAVYHDSGGFTYSFICSEDSVPSDILESYQFICNGIIKSLERLGLKAEFKPVNDIILNGKKVSGNAQTRRRGTVLQHGTLLLSVDVSTMFSLLKVPDEKLRDKMIKAVSERVTSLEEQLSRKVSFSEVSGAMEAGFSEVLGPMKQGLLTKNELENAKRLKREKYASKSWNDMR